MLSALRPLLTRYTTWLSAGHICLRLLLPLWCRLCLLHLLGVRSLLTLLRLLYLLVGLLRRRLLALSGRLSLGASLKLHLA